MSATASDGGRRSGRWCSGLRASACSRRRGPSAAVSVIVEGLTEVRPRERARAGGQRRTAGRWKQHGWMHCMRRGMSHRRDALEAGERRMAVAMEGPRRSAVVDRAGRSLRDLVEPGAGRHLDAGHRGGGGRAGRVGLPWSVAAPPSVPPMEQLIGNMSKALGLCVSTIRGAPPGRRRGRGVHERTDAATSCSVNPAGLRYEQ
jgi:hypothetical protein